jgi:Peptidase family M28
VRGHTHHRSHLLGHFADALTSRNDMMAWITEVVDHGVRRPGTDVGHRVEEWAASRFRYLGLEEVRREPVAVPVWQPGPARVVAWPESRPDEAVEVPGFPLPYTAPTEGTEASLVTLSPGNRNGTVQGAIALDTVELVRLSGELMATGATARYDPDGELDEYVHLLPFGPRLGREVDAAVEAGAAGYVGVLSGMPWDTRDYYVPYDAADRRLPAVWVDRAGGAALAELRRGAGEPVRARIEVQARRSEGTTSNVIGTLPGASDEWVVIGSHHDAPWASAVEDGSGIALVLAQARFWARVPARERPHNLLFLLNGGHMAGGAGLRSFLATHGDLLDRIVLSVHLEHAAAACAVDDDGKLVPTGEPEVRWWFTSREPGLEQSVSQSLADEDLHRSWVLPPDAFGEFPPTDGGMFHLHGVPLVDFLSAPAYLFDARDTLDKVHGPSLESITRAAIRIVEATAGRSAADLRGEGVDLVDLAPPEQRAV